MTNSTNTTITHYAIEQRAARDAQDAMPALPKTNTVEAWGAFVEEVEGVDAYEVAAYSSDWDWVIYHGRAMEVCQAVPSSVLHEAEGTFHEMDMASVLGEEIGLYEMASTLAHLIVESEIVDAVEAAKAELIEMAENQIENL